MCHCHCHCHCHFNLFLKQREFFKWEAMSLCETWRPRKTEVWESHFGHTYMGAGGFDNKHGVGVLLNTKWKRKILKTEYINERMSSATLKVNRRKVVLASVFFLHSEHAGHHVEKMYRCIETQATCRKHTTIIAGDFSAELGRGKWS